jgi:peptidoglycan hydrolase-like protein with peptidoglycan-binding domain
MVPIFCSGSTFAETKIIYPLSEISDLGCRFQKFGELSSSCKRELPILKSKDYKKYAEDNGGYNDYTRIYTVLWWASYKYWWDVWNGWHSWVDIATAEGTPVFAIADGKVEIAKNMISWGNIVSITHVINGKTVVSNYSHLSKISVNEWDKVSVWDKIWEVGSTGNSTGNHLHFQIDLKYKYHPFYYDYNTCPHTYNEISESDICFPELASHTIDPLVFLETQWAILDNIEIQSQDVDQVEAKSSLTTYNTSLSNGAVKIDAFDFTIFDRTIYIDSSKEDIKLVQQILKNLWVYEWSLNWDYNDVIDDVIEYQISRNIISSESDTGAWYFWPKTRLQAKNDYNKFLASGTKINTTQDVIVKNTNLAVEKISKQWLLTREEIEAREVKDFLKNYNIDLKFKDNGSNVGVGETIILNLSITDKKGKAFKWNMPWELNFITDREKIQVFPNKLYNFTDGKRDIQITWLITWDIKLYIRVGETTIKTFDIKIYDGKVKIYWETGRIITNSTVVLWEQKTWVLVIQDKNKKDLINLKYYWSYKLESKDTVVFCLKKWKISDIRKIYNSKCDSSNFKENLEFSYEDTVWWVLLFDYKILDTNAKISLINKSNNAIFSTKTIATVAPKGLAKSYEYYQDVVDMLKNGIVDGINKWYFLEKRELTKIDALDWIKNTLLVMKNNTWDNEIRKKIDTNIALIDKESPSKFEAVNRKEFLEKVYTYLVFDKNIEISINYKDLDEIYNKKANTVFDENNTWKDQFWKTYYRPEKSLTRWEWAYLLSTLFQRSEKTFVTLK